MPRRLLAGSPTSKRRRVSRRIISASIARCSRPRSESARLRRSLACGAAAATWSSRSNELADRDLLQHAQIDRAATGRGRRALSNCSLIACENSTSLRESNPASASVQVSVPLKPNRRSQAFGLLGVERVRLEDWVDLADHAGADPRATARARGGGRSCPSWSWESCAPR